MAVFDNLNPTVLGAVDWLGRDRITSAYRSPKHRVEARKRQPGQHAHGNALDISIKGMTPEQVLADVEKLKAQGFKRFIMYPGGTHLHADTSDAQGDFHKMYAGTKGRMNEAPRWWRDYTPGGGYTIPPEAITGDPNIYSGSVMPVSATGGEAPPVMNLQNEALLKLVGGPNDLSPVQDAPKSMVNRLASNPMVQMGLGLLANNPNFGQGLQQGLLSAAKADQFATSNEMKRRQQQLFQQQNMLGLGRSLGLGSTSPDARLQAQTARMQNAYKQQQLAQRIAEHQNPAATSQKLPADAAMIQWAMQNIPETQGDPVKAAEWVQNYNQSGKKGAPGAGGTDPLVADAWKFYQGVKAQIDKNPEVMKAFGSVGGAGQWAHEAGRTFQDFTGSDVGVNIANHFFSEDPTDIRTGIEKYTLPVIRTLVEPKGVISGAERTAGRELVGLRAKAGELKARQEGFLKNPKSAETGWKIFSDTMELLGEVNRIAQGESLPPSLDPAPSQETAAGEPDWGSMTTEEIENWSPNQ